MMKKQQQQPIPTRLQMHHMLLGQFNRDYSNMLQHYNTGDQVELTEHLIAAVAAIQEHTITRLEQHRSRYLAAELELAKKYGVRLQPYSHAQFYKYFDFDLVLSEKGVLNDMQFNMLAAEQQRLSKDEALALLASLTRLLYSSVFLLLQQPTGDNLQTAGVTVNDTVSWSDEPDNEMTKARQLLAIYYFMHGAYGLTGTNQNSGSATARFIHLLTGTRFTTIQNSDIYKKYLKMPSYKTERKLIEDLKYIRTFFTDLEMHTAVAEIDHEMQRAIRELPLLERRKYKQDTDE